MRTREEQYLLLTSVPRWVTITLLIEYFGVSTTLATSVFQLCERNGIFAKPQPKLGHPVLPATALLVKEFYLSPEVSRMNPNMADVMKVATKGADGTKRMDSVVKQELLSTLDQL